MGKYSIHLSSYTDPSTKIPVFNLYVDGVCIFDGVPQFEIDKGALANGLPVTDLLAASTQVFSSKGEAKKMIQGGGVSVNKVKVADVDAIFNADNLIAGKYLIAQRGKKNYYLIIAR